MEPASTCAELVAVLRRELEILGRLRYSHRQLRVLFEAEDCRFLGVALDELTDAMVEFELAEQLRTEATEEISSALDVQPMGTLTGFIAVLPFEFAQSLRSLQRELDGLLHDVDIERNRVRALSHARVSGRIGHRRAG